ncbi:MAG: prephenate dehydrogenase [Anaerovoracaceae bacterium]|jgi:prephenate dehydrogenase
MKIGMIGLGLIGGSIAKAIKENTNHLVYGIDLQEPIVYKAILLEAIDGKLTDEILKECDLVIIALYPKAAMDFIQEKKTQFKKGAIVLDCCGVKEEVCNMAFPIAQENDFIFVGGHPMAGIEFSGFEYSQKTLFKNASMILTPSSDTDIRTMAKLKKLWLSLGFTHVQIATPKEHDRMIAFTSQLAHVVSNAYIKSPSADKHRGFSAGSYKDLSRVAKLNPDMWTELFFMNRDFLVEELDNIIERLNEYRQAIKIGDEEGLWKLLKEGSDRKIAIDD